MNVIKMGTMALALLVGGGIGASVARASTPAQPHPWEVLDDCPSDNPCTMSDGHTICCADYQWCDPDHGCMNHD